MQDRRPNPAFADITYAFNGGKSRYKDCRRSGSGARRDMTLLNSLTLSETKDNGAQSLENSNGNFPAPQDFRNLEADFGLSNYHQPYNNTTSFVGAAVRQAPVAVRRRLARRAGWRLEIAGINWLYAGEPVTFTYTRARPSSCPASPRIPRREQLPAERDLRSDGDRRGPHHQQLVQPRVRLGADRSEPAVRQRRAQLGARAELLGLDFVASKRRSDRRSSSSGSRRSTC